MTGIDYLLPHDPEADRFALFQVEYLRATPEERAEFAPMRYFFYYPLFIARGVLLLPSPDRPDAPLDDDGLGAHLEAASLLTVQGRSVVAFFSILGVLGTWWIARRLIGPWPALLATTWIAVNLTCVIYSAQARPHALAGGLGTLAVAGSLWLRRRPTVGVYLLASIANAAAVGGLHNAAAVLGALFFAHVLRDRDAERGGAWKALLPIAAILASVYFFYPGFHAEKGGTDQASDVQATGLDFAWILDHRSELGTFTGAGFSRLARFTWGYEPVLVVAALLGLAYALTRLPRGGDPGARARRRDLAVVLGHALPYALVMGIYAHSPARYMIPLMPYLAILAAVGALWPVRLLARRWSARTRNVACITASVLWLAVPTYAVAHLTALRVRPDTREEMADWMLEHVPAGARVLLGPGGWIPLDYGPGTIKPSNPNTQPCTIPWLRYQLRLTDRARETRFDFVDLDWGKGNREKSFRDPRRAARFLRESGAEYLVLENSDRLRVFGDGSFEKLRGAARNLGKLEMVFRPRGPDGDRAYHDYDHSWHMFDRTLESESLGPIVELWRLTR